MACSQDIDRVPRKTWKRTDIRESLHDVVEAFEDEVEQLLEERQEYAEGCIEQVYGVKLPLEDALSSLVVKCIKAGGERVLAQSRQSHVYFDAVEKSVTPLSAEDAKPVRQAMQILLEVMDEDRRNGGHSERALWPVYQACENAVLVAEECLEKYGPKIVEVATSPPVDPTKAAYVVVEGYGCEALSLSGVVAALVIQYLLDTTHCLHFANTCLRVSQKQIAQIKETSDDAIGSYMQHMSRELQFLLKILRGGISSAGCSLVDYYYTQKQKMQADSPPWQSPPIPIDGSSGPKMYSGMFDGADAFLSVRQLLVLSTALQEVSDQSQTTHVAAADFVQCVVEMALNEGFPSAWTQPDKVRAIAHTFSTWGSSGGVVHWRKVLHSAMYAILPRPPSAVQLINMIESLAPVADSSVPASVASLPENFKFWFESESSTSTQQQANPPAPPNYPLQSWGAGGEARELYLTMFSSPNTGAIHVESLMLLLCCWYDAFALVFFLFGGGGGGSCRSLDVVCFLLYSLLISQVTDTPTKRLTSATSYPILVRACREDNAAGEAVDILGEIETHAGLGLARACLMTSAFHGSLCAAKRGMKRILDVHGDVFETSQIHSKPFDAPDRLLSEHFGIPATAMAALLGSEVDPETVLSLQKFVTNTNVSECLGALVS